MSLRRAWINVIFLVVLGLSVCGYVYYAYGQTKGLEFLTAYIIEYAMSVDNLFVFALIFSFFRISDKDQSKLLFYGILGAIILRGVFILAGITLIGYFNWLFYLFGAFLIYTGLKLALGKDDDYKPGQGWVYWLAASMGVRPFFLFLTIIELTDLLFATDSIPAVLAITTDPMIVIGSNILAVAGLRSLYFVLRELLKKFHYLKAALSVILVFIGLKMFLNFFYHLAILASLSFIGLTLFVAVVASIIKHKRLQWKKA